MIPLTRARGAVEIHSNFIDPRRESYNCELLIERREHFRNPAEKQEFDKSRWKKAKIQLLKESNDKCAYCEAPTATVCYGDVEHYRPTSKYWWLAYCYENYLPSCQICNQKYKKANFRVQGLKMRSPATIRSDTSDAFIDSKKASLTPDSLDTGSVLSFTRIHEAEHAFIVNPYFDDPSDWFAWKEDDVTKRVRLVSARNTALAINVVKAAERDLGLNRIELQELRYVQFLLFRTFKRTLRDPGISDETKNETEYAIQEMLTAKAPFAGMMRYFDLIL